MTVVSVVGAAALLARPPEAKSKFRRNQRLAVAIQPFMPVG